VGLHAFTRFSNAASRFAGSSQTFIGAVLFVFIWALFGPFFQFHDTWQLVINTTTTIISFWMVFLIQNSQNRDSLAIHLKLDQLILALKDADNKYIPLENLDESELRELRQKINVRLK
jgi:low affinity Fe/Cu permease